MNGQPSPPRSPDPSRLVAIGVTVLCMAIALVVYGPNPRPSRDVVLAPTPPVPAPDPIPSEALVFRTHASDLAVPLDAPMRTDAQVRTLATFRSRRAFPGAPPRVPHGLTLAEFDGQLCLSCHRRGGFVQRFGAYAPVTPHPEWTECLQCHPADGMRVGILDTVGRTPRSDMVCRQCHVDPDRPPPSLVSLDWTPAPWPTIGRQALPGSPNVIPHSLQYRGNCLTCHAGPGAVREIRTKHPGRANCRQCHATSETDTAFTRAEP